jgi:hypothetical protein
MIRLKAPVFSLEGFFFGGYVTGIRAWLVWDMVCVFRWLWGGRMALQVRCDRNDVTWLIWTQADLWVACLWRRAKTLTERRP